MALVRQPADVCYDDGAGGAGDEDGREEAANAGPLGGAPGRRPRRRLPEVGRELCPRAEPGGPEH